MNPLYRGLLESLVRKAVTGLSFVLITHGLLTEASSSAFVSSVTEVLAGLIVLGVSLALSALKERKTQKVFGAALALPAGSTKEEAFAAAKLPEAPPATLPLDLPPRPMRMP